MLESYLINIVEKLHLNDTKRKISLALSLLILFSFVNIPAAASADEFSQDEQTLAYEVQEEVENPGNPQEGKEPEEGGEQVETTYTVRYSNGEGYEIIPTGESNNTVAAGGSFSFKVVVSEGYNGARLTVRAGGSEVPKSGDVYTISNIQSDVTIEVSGVVDDIKPTGTITIGKKSWDSFQDSIENKIYFSGKQVVKITADDKGSGIGGIYYIAKDAFYSEAKLKGLSSSSWNKLDSTGTFTLSSEAIIYVKIVDKASNEIYICSDKIAFDSIKPSITGIENGKSYSEAKTVTVTDDNLDYVTVNGDRQELDENNSFTLKVTNKDYEIIAVDKAGNTATVKVGMYESFTVTLPKGDNYTVAPYGDSMSPVLYGGSFSFKVTVKAGYDASKLTVLVNESPVAADDNGVYTISNIKENITVTIANIEDNVKPTGTITFGNKQWSSFSSTSSKLYYKEIKDVVISGSDQGSGIKEIAYYISSTSLSQEAMSTVATWKSIANGGKVTISDDGEHIIYVKLKDAAGNESYICSDILVLDTVSPEVSGIEDNATYYEEKTVTIADANLKSVTVDGKEQQLDGSNSFKLEVLNKEVKIIATDKAGNSTVRTVKLYEKFKVTLPTGEGYVAAPCDGYESTVVYGKDFRFTITPKAGYSTENMVVKANGEIITPVNGVYTISNIQENINITIGDVADREAPEGTIEIGKNQWKSFLNTITFGIFFNDTQTVKITATDAGTGVKSICYFLSKDKYTSDQLSNDSSISWTSLGSGGSFTIAPDKTVIIYARFEDNANNVSYICSNGLVFDGTKPVITGVEEGKSYNEEKTITVKDDYLDSVTVNGAKQTLTNDQFVLKQNINGEAKIIAKDKAGNERTVTVYIYENYSVKYSNGEGYEIVPIDSSKTSVVYGDSYSFRVKVAEGYNSTAMVVKANTDELKANDGIYTIKNITENKTISVTGVADKEEASGKITVGSNVWTDFRENVTPNVYFNKEQAAVITGEDRGSGLSKLYYRISSSAMTVSQLSSSRGWTEIESGEKITISPNREAIIYVKLVDKAGNISYINSSVIVLDDKAPVFNGIENGKTYNDKVNVKIEEAYLKEVTVDGKAITLNSDQSFTLATRDSKYTVKAVDEAGNYTEVTVYVYAQPGTPKITSIESKGFDAIMLSWSKTEATEGYELYRGEDKLNYKVIKDINNNESLSYQDSGLTCGIKYYYKVRSYKLVDGEKKYGAYSEVADITPRPVAVNLISVESAGYDSIKLTWEVMSGSSGYQILRATDKDFNNPEPITIDDPSTTEYVDKGLTAGKEYYYKIQAFKRAESGNENTLGEFSKVMSAKPVIEKMTFTKVASAGYNSIQLQWKALNGAAGYEIYMSTSKDTGFDKPIYTAKGDATSYTKTGLEPGTTYYFKARAYSAVDEESKVWGAYSDIKSAYPRPGTPTVTATCENTTTVSLSWTKVPGAEGYQVYISTSKDSDYKRIATITNGDTTTYTKKKLDVGVTYYFKVRAYLALEDGSNLYGVSSVAADVKTQPAQVKFITAGSAGYNSANLEWEKIPDATYYQIYMSTNRDSGYKRIATKEVGITTYTYKKLEAGVTYYFKIRAYTVVEDKNVYGAFSSVKSVKPVPSKVTISSATSTTYNNAKLTWEKVAGANGYQIYYSTTRDSDYTKIKTITDGSICNYTYSKLQTGVTYYFKIRAYVEKSDGSRVYGPFSTIKNVKPQLPKPSISSIASNSSGSITLKWNKVSGAQGYQIYRLDPKTNDYVKIKTVSSDTTTFTNTGLKSRTTYYYKIKAYRKVDNKTVYSSFSPVKTCRAK